MARQCHWAVIYLTYYRHVGAKLATYQQLSLITVEVRIWREKHLLGCLIFCELTCSWRLIMQNIFICSYLRFEVYVRPLKARFFLRWSFHSFTYAVVKRKLDHSSCFISKGEKVEHAHTIVEELWKIAICCRENPLHSESQGLELEIR